MNEKNEKKQRTAIPPPAKNKVGRKPREDRETVRWGDGHPYQMWFTQSEWIAVQQEVKDNNWPSVSAYVRHKLGFETTPEGDGK